ncbi:MAG: hypothetical protein Q8T13_04890 [Acidobacteriota bacterium]|nr:hypothetical protein [Acidobacteriota bacterium]
MSEPSAATFKVISITTEAGVELANVRAVTGPDVITVKRLGWRRLEEAEKANTKAAIAHVRELGGMAVVKEIREAGGRPAIEAAAKADPLVSYDIGVLLTIGVTSLDSEGIDELEPATAKAVAREVLRLSNPSLFESEDERKNA